MYCLILDPPWVRLALAKNEPSQGIRAPKSRLLGYFCSPVFGVGCALFAAFFSRESSSRRACTRIGCGANRRGRICRMAAFYLLADETVQNQQQQDCRLIVEISAPDGADNQRLHKAAEIAIKEKFGTALTLKINPTKICPRRPRHLEEFDNPTWSGI